jgi:hypothetical protein
LDDNVEMNEMGRACSVYEEERRIQDFGGETSGKEITWKNNIEVNLQEVGSSWLRIGTGGGHL